MSSLENSIKITEEHIIVPKKTRTKKEKIEVPTCAICIEPYNRSSRFKITCEYCSQDACTECCKRYILQESVPKCMSGDCNRQWTPEFISKIFSKKFVNTDLKLHYEKVLFDKHRALLPATQPLVENILKREEYVRRINSAAEVVTKARIEMNKIQSEYYRFTHTDPSTQERATFIRACPSPDCHGFLSSQWKCGLCNIWTCPTCHEIKGLERDGEHTCHPDNIATANLLNSDTKPCPKCGEGIFKIDGCFAADIPVLMWNGSTKMSQDIALGDILVGDDGKPRNVIRLMQGEDDLYEVDQNNGMNYTVNSKHKLALKYSGNKSIFWIEKSKSWRVHWFNKENNKTKSKNFKVDEDNDKEKTKELARQFIQELYTDETIEIRIDDYMQLNDSMKNYLMGYKFGWIDYSSQPVDLDPYMLGLWLGDGTHCDPCIASNDKEIVDYMISWCNNNNAELMKVKTNKYLYRIRRKGYGFSCDEILSLDRKTTKSEAQFPCYEDRTNPFTDLLKKYNLLRNKHIPQEYLMNDRSVRLNLLAGIIDTDGHVNKAQEGKRIMITQTRVMLSKQIIFLARSLGFNVNYRIIKKQGISIFGGEKKDYKDQYVINISGENLHEIPTLLPRKKCADCTKNLFNTSIKVKYVGKGKYYGWTLSGTNNRFLLEDATVTLNCNQIWCTQCHTAFCWRTGKIETDAIHNPHYFEWMRRNGTLERNPNDIICGRELNQNSNLLLRQLMTAKEITDNKQAVKIKQLYNNVSEVCRKVIHFRYVSIPNYQYNSERVTQELRIRYMRNYIDEDQFKILLQKDYKKSNKYREILEVIQLLTVTITDIVLRFIEEIKDPTWTYNLERMREIDEIVKYANECFLKISRTYNSTPLTFKGL